MAILLRDLFSPARIKTRVEAEDKDEVFEELVDLLVTQYRLDCRDEILEAIRRREEKMSTGHQARDRDPARQDRLREGVIGRASGSRRRASTTRASTASPCTCCSSS